MSDEAAAGLGWAKSAAALDAPFESSKSDTIFAVAAGGLGAALTVLRMSGSDAGAILDKVAGGRPQPRFAALRRLRNGDGEVLDAGLVLWFPGPRSYTGEDSAELHLHGGRAVLKAVASALVEAGARPAEPGEFTRRAFLNGKMDLTAAEAVADLVDAETEAQRRQALRQLQGELGSLYRGWAARLLRIMASYEALIDFGTEDTTPDDDAAIQTEIAHLHDEIASHLNDGQRGERVRDGLVFVIAGPPNVGKSSLLNALASRDIAIVSATPGTTRDVLEARLELSGVAVTLLDTAGLRHTADAVELEGIRRARASAAAADLVLDIYDAREISVPAVAEAIAMPASAGRRIRVANKIDLVSSRSPGLRGVSAQTGEGLDALRATLAEAATDMTRGSSNVPLTRVRHRIALQDVIQQLLNSMAAPCVELRAEDVRAAVASLGRITGQVGVEDVLDSVFSQFCIGK